VQGAGAIVIFIFSLVSIIENLLHGMPLLTPLGLDFRSAVHSEEHSNQRCVNYKTSFVQAIVSPLQYSKPVFGSAAAAEGVTPGKKNPGACFKYRYVPPFLTDRQRHQHHIHAEAMFENSAWLLIIAVRSPISDWDFPLVRVSSFSLAQA